MGVVVFLLYILEMSEMLVGEVGGVDFGWSKSKKQVDDCDAIPE